MTIPSKLRPKKITKFHNIVGVNMLHTFGHPIVMCCDMLGVAAHKSGNGQMLTGNTQHVPKCPKRVAKHRNML